MRGRYLDPVVSPLNPHLFILYEIQTIYSVNVLMSCNLKNHIINVYNSSLNHWYHSIEYRYHKSNCNGDFEGARPTWIL